MPGVTKSAPARRQTQRDHATPVVVIPKSQTVKTRSNAYSSPNLYADAHDASSCHVIVREAESSRNVSFEAIRRPDATPRASRGKRQSPATKVTPANHQLSTLLLSDSGPTTPSQSPANPSSVAEHYPFGWNAFPTRAHVNEVCRRFLRGCCPLAANCIRIHPRDDNFREDAPDAKVFVVKLPTQQSSFRPDVRLAPQIDTVSKEPNDVSKPCKLLYPSGVKPGVPLRYDPERGLLLYQADSDRGQTSDSSQHFSAVASPAESSCSLTSEDTEVTTSSTHPPPPSIYLCRHWLMKRCERRYDCPFVHGDLEYEPPVRGVYPPPKSQTRCMRSEQGACSRGYLCMYFHDDLKYGKPFEQTIPSCRSGDGLTNHVSSNPPLDAEATTTPAAKEEKPADNIVGYPPPKSNHFCRYWLLNRCFRGPHCNYFHGDVEYDRPVQGVHPPPRYSQTCKLWLQRKCCLGFACDFVHGDLKYDLPEPRRPLQQHHGPSGRPPEHGCPAATQDRGEDHLQHPRSREICRKWVRNMCQRGYACDYSHPDLLYGDAPSDTPSSKTALVDDPTKDPPVGMRPPPKSPETCIQWLRDRCSLRYACKYRHDDLEYDPPRSTDNSAPSNIASNHDMSTEVHPWSLRVHDHAKVKLGPGFEILEVATGFETPWLYLTNVPARATADDVADLLRPFGDVLDVKLPSRVNNATMIVRVRFSSPSEARQASTSLNGTQALGGKITARLPVHDASCHRTMLEDTAVRIRWQAPSKVGYGGYSTMEHAKEALAASRKPFRDHYVHASVHVGLPVVGVVTVCFRGVPLEATKADMAWFAKPNDVVWARPNYQSLDLSTQGIKAILQEGGELLDFVVLPPPYKSGAKVQAWAHFSTPSDAKAACRRLHDRKPMFTGKTKVTAEHVQSLTFSIFPGVYAKLSDDIQALCRTLHHSRRIAMSVIQRPTPMPTLVKVFSDDIKELGHFKAEFEAVLKGETVFQGTNVAWDPFFAHPAGKAFVEALECEIPAVTIHVDISRRTIRLLGSSEPRLTVRQRILDKMKELHSQQTHAILLDGRLLGYFMGKGLAQLQTQFGRENVNLDMRNRRLIIRGSDAAHEFAREAVRRGRQARLPPARRRTAPQCPVCFDDVTCPVTLPCGHSWCRDCISRYLVSAVDNKYLPLTCLGGDAKCSKLIPLDLARNVLTIPEFDAVVDAALASYIHSHPDEFHYCPTPDCPQFYRSAPRDTVLQCPSCLLRICPNCHIEAHDGFPCPDSEGDNTLFREWVHDHDVKSCPGCKVPIERAEGCHHMTCTQCKTHICWVCLQTFPNGNGIYDHMREAHGGIGLGTD